MTNEQVVKAFFQVYSAKSLNMSTDGKRLFSYNTIIAEYKNGCVYFNTTKYSNTTSHHQGLVKRIMDKFIDFRTTKNVPFNTQCNLERFV